MLVLPVLQVAHHIRRELQGILPHQGRGEVGLFTQEELEDLEAGLACARPKV